MKQTKQSYINKSLVLDEKQLSGSLPIWYQSYQMYFESNPKGDRSIPLSTIWDIKVVTVHPYAYECLATFSNGTKRIVGWIPALLVKGIE